MKRSSLALASALLSSCMLTPTDDQRVSSTTAPLDIIGYHVEPSTAVQVRAWDFTTHSMRNLGLPAISASTSTASLERPLYAWQASRTLAPSFWRNGPVAGRCAIVDGRTTMNGTAYNVVTVEQNWAECLDDNPTTGEFATNCRASNAPVAKVYTNDWAARTINAGTLTLAGAVAGTRITLNLDNYIEPGYTFCNASNPAGCPPGGASDPETWKYYSPNASFLQQGADAATAMRFSIVPTRDNPRTIYIDDMRSSSMDLRAQSGALVLGINFEATGPEIRTNCVRNAECPFSDGFSIDFTRPRAEIRFTLTTAGGKVRYTNAAVTFTGWPAGTALDERNTNAQNSVGVAMGEKLNGDPAIKAAVGDALDMVLREAGSLGNFPIDEVSVVGTGVSVLPGCLQD